MARRSSAAGGACFRSGSVPTVCTRLHQPRVEGHDRGPRTLQLYIFDLIRDDDDLGTCSVGRLSWVPGVRGGTPKNGTSGRVIKHAHSCPARGSHHVYEAAPLLAQRLGSAVQCCGCMWRLLLWRTHQAR